MKAALWYLLIGLLAFAARCYNAPETFILGHLYFVDGDCYARMTRARIIDEHPGAIIHFHDFENYPDGVRSHTTAPMDYMIVALKGVLRVTAPIWSALPGAAAFRDQTLDLAGALISPLLGALSCMYLAWWTRRGLQFPAESRWPKIAWVAPVFFAICPIVAHAGALGRPDHQSPMLLFVTVAISAEFTLLQSAELSAKARRAWLIAAGGAWGMSLWISLYEPLILLLGMAVLVPLFFGGAAILRRDRWWEFGVLIALVALMLALEGDPWPQLAPEVKEYFGRWTKTVAELRGLSLAGGALYRWIGWLAIPAPVLLVIAARKLDRRAGLVLVLLIGMVIASAIYLRWGYFLGLAFALALPWMLAPLRRRWIATAIVCVSLVPLAFEWGEILPAKVKRPLPWLACGLSFYSFRGDWEKQLEHDEEQLSVKRRERSLLRDVAAHIVPGEIHPFLVSPRHGAVPQALRTDPQGRAPFLAPWWLSPALAYWSHQPGVTGSAHEGLPGIVDSARLYLAADPIAAAQVLEKRRVAYVVVDEPTRIVETSTPLLAIAAPTLPLVDTLYIAPHSGPAFLVLTHANSYYKLFAVDESKLHPK